MSRAPSVECYISPGIKFITRKRIDTLCFNLNISRGALLDLMIGSVPPRTTKKMKAQQKKMLKLTLIRKGKKFFREAMKKS